MSQLELGGSTLFRCIVADPPWNESGGGRIKRGADRHYPLLKTANDVVDVMRRAPVWLPAPDCHLWLWATSNHLEDAFVVGRALGFRFVTTSVWVKMRDVDMRALAYAPRLLEAARDSLQIGLGQYLRHAHEIALLFTRGEAAVPESASRPTSAVLAQRTAHSRKPAEFFGLVEAVSPAPRLEMFARSRRAGWVVWGNEIP